MALTILDEDCGGLEAQRSWVRVNSVGKLLAALSTCTCALLSLMHPRVAAGGARRGLMLGRSALRADSTAMLGLGSRRGTHCAHLRSLRSNSRDESVVDARCARRPQACASRRPRNRPTEHRPPRCQRVGACDEDHDAAAIAHPGRRRCAWEALSIAATVAALAVRFVD